MTHMLISAVIHGIMYALIWRALGRLPLPEAAVLGVLAIGIIWLLRIMIRKPRRRWR